MPQEIFESTPSFALLQNGPFWYAPCSMASSHRKAFALQDSRSGFCPWRWGSTPPMIFDPLQHIDLTKSATPFDGVFTNHAMWNYSIEDNVTIAGLLYGLLYITHFGGLICIRRSCLGGLVGDNRRDQATRTAEVRYPPFIPRTTRLFRSQRGYADIVLRPRMRRSHLQRRSPLTPLQDDTHPGHDSQSHRA